MARTTAELATEVMRLPNWLEAQEEADSQDAAHILRVYEDLYAEWTIPGKTIAYWPYDAIPNEVFRHIVRIIADHVAPTFGDAAPMEIDPVSGTQVSMGVRGWLGLKRVVARDRSGLPTETCYF